MSVVDDKKNSLPVIQHRQEPEDVLLQQLLD